MRYAVALFAMLCSPAFADQSDYDRGYNNPYAAASVLSDNDYQRGVNDADDDERIEHDRVESNESDSGSK